MTNEEKQLLLKDICARFLYGVKGIHSGRPETIANISILGYYKNTSRDGWHHIEDFKPYLRPMSSMTEEEKRAYLTLRAHALPFSIVEWLDEKHFDHRTNMNGEHLIEMGLALEAPEGMYES